MKPIERVLAAIERKPFDRVPIRHLADSEVNDSLYDNYCIERGDYDSLLDALGDDFRSIAPFFKEEFPARHVSAADINSPGGIPDDIFPKADWYDYSEIKNQCEKYRGYAKIAGYCEFDFINSISFVRGYERVITDIAELNPVYLKLVEIRAERVSAYIKNILLAAGGEIDIVHFGEDLGTQLNLMISMDTFDGLFADHYKNAFATAHAYGAKTMLHSCGSVWKAIPRLIELGLDILDVVQTNAAGMEIERLHAMFGSGICFAGTMCVQNVLPFESKETVEYEVKKRLELFSRGGLILGPSHLINKETPLENILAMYKTANEYRPI
ncbi:MAG: hypothetical protein FWE82_04255 [Defluviitaleaceae bacterium]|nr:hypothetical protein [Defluviitaleaceae bacterium]